MTGRTVPTRNTSIISILVNEIPSRREAQKILDSKLRPINQGRLLPQFTIPLEQFVREQWEPATLPTLKVGSTRYYGKQLRCHVLPALGTTRLCDITRVKVQIFLAEKRNSGLSGSSVHGMRTASTRTQFQNHRGARWTKSLRFCSQMFAKHRRH
jgi:hypothetical protein